MNPDLLTPEEAAALLRVTPATLGYWRKQKRGPAYVKIGRRVRYPRAALFAALQATAAILQITTTLKGTSK